MHLKRQIFVTRSVFLLFPAANLVLYNRRKYTGQCLYMSKLNLGP